MSTFYFVSVFCLDVFLLLQFLSDFVAWYDGRKRKPERAGKYAMPRRCTSRRECEPFDPHYYTACLLDRNHDGGHQYADFARNPEEEAKLQRMLEK